MVSAAVESVQKKAIEFRGSHQDFIGTQKLFDDSAFIRRILNR